MSRYVDIEPLDFIAFTDKSEDFLDGVNWAMEQVDKCAEWPQAKWIAYPHGSGIYCSRCHSRHRYKDYVWEYCPCCGAKMEVEDE